MTSLCTSQRRRGYVSKETPNDVSVERRQDVSVVHLHDVLLVCRDDVSRGRNDDVPSVRLHDVSNKSQMKHPITSLWYVSTASQSYVVATPCLYNGLYYVFKLLCHIVGFHVSFKHQIKHHIFKYPPGRKKRSSLDYKLAELLLHLKTASYINNICNIFCVDIYLLEKSYIV